jgi:hypothetical protein
MARTIGSSFSTQLSSGSVRPFYAISFAYSTPLRITTADTNVTIDGEIYTSTADIMEISEINETAETKATGLNVVFSGISSSLISSSLTETQQGVDVDLYFGVLTTTSNQTVVVDTPYTLFKGQVDTVSISEAGDTSTIKFSIENKLIALEKPLDFRYTDQDQKQFFPNDKGLEFVADLQDKNIVWGGGGN